MATSGPKEANLSKMRNGQLLENVKFGMGNFALISFRTSLQTSSIEISKTSLMACNSASWSGVAASSTSFSC